jgi:peptidoglycan/LPS O-acetylase OafA/YrhL
MLSVPRKYRSAILSGNLARGSAAWHHPAFSSTICPHEPRKHPHPWPRHPACARRHAGGAAPLRAVRQRRGTFGWVGEIGWVGVDLFFALSGYLIGNQIFRPCAARKACRCGRFYARRLLRTLPNFYVVLALYALWPAFRGGTPMLPLWQYLSFTQNIGLEPGTAFSHAWSLCIEEQFYMLLPACALLAAALGRRGAGLRWAWIAVGAGLRGGDGDPRRPLAARAG